MKRLNLRFFNGSPFSVRWLGMKKHIFKLTNKNLRVADQGDFIHIIQGTVKPAHVGISIKRSPVTCPVLENFI